MNGKVFSTTITPLGAERLANAALTGVPVSFAEMAVGDGGGTLPKVGDAASGLIDEKYRGPLNRLVIADSDASIIEAEMIMPPQVGGFWLRELALYADDGACIATGNMPETYKPLLAEGSGRFQILRMQLKVSSTADVELIADPSVILATSEDVGKARDEAKDYADKLADEIGKAMEEAISQARRDAWEDDNPPGTVRFFAQNVDPNEKWPWSQWTYTGENKTIRVGKADGSNVGATGGSDTVTIQKDNLPAVQINVSGETSELAARELTARGAGRHRHQAGMVAPGDVWDGDYVVGSDNDSHRTRNYTDWAEDHTHIVDEPAHRHTTTGKTDNLGNGQAINVVEAHTLLMCWARVA